MRNECNIIRDLLPLYAENMVSPDTRLFVEEHLKECKTCQNELAQLEEPQTIQVKEDALPLITLKRKLFAKKVQTIAFTMILVIVLLVSMFAFLDAPEYFLYSPELIELNENPDGSITLTFDKSVTDFSCTFCEEPLDEFSSAENSGYNYHIEAWTSTWDKWFSKRSSLSTTIKPEKDLPYKIFYTSNNGQEDVCLYGQSNLNNGGVITLPRLSLGYYLILAVFTFAALFALRFIVRKKDNFRIWVEKLLLYPLSYIIAHLCIMGITTTSYSMPRDFFLILFVSVLLYCGLLLVVNIYQLHKEIKSVNSI